MLSTTDISHEPEETDGITTDVWDEDGAERPQLSQAVMD